MIIIQDTREQTPWDFTFYGYEQKVQGLKTGDYTLEGYENLFCIERKRTTGEIAVNLGSKRVPFMKEMARMQDFKYKFIICEFTHERLMEFPYNSGIPKVMIPKIRINKYYLSSSLQKLNDGGINVIYCNGKAEAELEAVRIFEDIVNGQLR